MPLLVALFLLVPTMLNGQLDPGIDKPGEPFSYFSRPTDVIGVMDAPAATLITPEGYLYTDYGELMFFTGSPRVAVDQRVKTLLNGYLPVIQYGFVRGDISYQITAFAATLDGRPDGPLADFVRVNIRNRANNTVVAHFATAFRHQDATREFFYRPAPADRLGDYMQLGEEFNSQWTYRFAGNTLL